MNEVEMLGSALERHGVPPEQVEASQACRKLYCWTAEARQLCVVIIAIYRYCLLIALVSIL